MQAQYYQIRKETFFEENQLDLELLDVVKNHESHQFLVNPSGQLVYLYLTKYVQRFCEFYFNKQCNELKILDWGCGKGHITFLMEKLGANPISCDLAAPTPDSSFGQATPLLQHLRRSVQPLHHSYQLPYETSSIDVVLSFGVLEHVPEDGKSLQEINRILSEQGLLFVFFLPYTFSWTQYLAHRLGNYYHDRLYSKRLVNQLLVQSNFKLLDLWHRQIFPKNRFNYPSPLMFERLDQLITTYTPLKYFATNLEFVACKDFVCNV